MTSTGAMESCRGGTKQTSWGHCGDLLIYFMALSASVGFIGHWVLVPERPCPGNPACGAGPRMERGTGDVCLPGWVGCKLEMMPTMKQSP